MIISLLCKAHLMVILRVSMSIISSCSDSRRLRFAVAGAFTTTLAKAFAHAFSFEFTFAFALAFALAFEIIVAFAPDR